MPSCGQPDPADLEGRLLAAPQPAGLEIPPVLRDSVARHQANLLRLLESFRAAGMDDAQIEPAVTVVIDSYRRELLDAIRSLAAAGDGAGGTP